jgi:hypothetical protein
MFFYVCLCTEDVPCMNIKVRRVYLCTVASLNAYISVEKMVKKNEVHQLCRNVVLRWRAVIHQNIDSRIFSIVKYIIITVCGSSNSSLIASHLNKIFKITLASSRGQYLC